jgi:hypothetical protein
MSNYDDLSKLSVEELLHLFVTHETERSALGSPFDHPRGTLDDYDYAAASAAHHRAMAVYSELRRRGRDAQMRLLDLLSHPDPGLRNSVVRHALELRADL